MVQYYPDTTKRFDTTLDAPPQEEVRSVHLTQSEKSSSWNKMMLYMEEHPMPEEKAHAEYQKMPSKRSPLVVGLVAVLALVILGILSASQYSLPGSPLHFLKTNINEPIRTGISALTGTQSEWDQRRALHRLYEAEMLFKKQRLDEGTATTLVAQFHDAQKPLLASEKASATPRIENYKNEVLGYYNRFQEKITEGGNLGLPIFIAGVKDAIGKIDVVLNKRSGVGSMAKSTANAAIEIGVSLSKKIFAAQETMQITVSARNTGTADQRFDFRTGCQSKYWIDTKEFGSEFCTQALTSFTLPPNTSRQWSFMAQAPKNPGNHTVTGEVIDYGNASIDIEVRK
ncbi:hypothetical protein HY620_02885 [Candidatus Uhrbacteria bacterium]|nr:hypothetical protein [Candidatus Uhrbacteria bacterium]